MGAFNFTYEIPSTFDTRVAQFFIQFGKQELVDAFRQCSFESEDQGLAYYAGLRGDNWNKRAVDITIEGSESNTSLLQQNDRLVKDVIGKALKPSESGLLVRNVFYLVSDIVISEPASDIERLNADIETANGVLTDLVWIGERACSNQAYDYSCTENTINDYFRDMFLSKGYDETKDQTRHGTSLSGKDAGEVDILFTKGGEEIALFEGLKLSSVDTNYINTHIKKAIDNYNALGTATFIVAYVKSANYQQFWERYIEHLKAYKYDLDVKRTLVVKPHPNAATRIATTILSRDGFDFPVYFIAFKIE